MSSSRMFSETPSAGLVLSESFRIYFANLPAFAGIIVLVNLPAIALFAIGLFGIGSTYDATRTSFDPASSGAIVITLAAVALFVVCNQLGTAAITYGVFQSVRGRPIKIGECLRVGFQQLAAVLLAALLVGILIMIGVIACVVPGIIAGLMLAVVIPVTVVESVDVGAAMARSRYLTQGRRGVVAGVGLTLGLMQVAVNLAFEGLALINPMLSYLSLIPAILFSGLYATALAVLYYALRSAKESIGVDEIARIFE